MPTDPSSAYSMFCSTFFMYLSIIHCILSYLSLRRFLPRIATFVFPYRALSLSSLILSTMRVSAIKLAEKKTVSASACTTVALVIYLIQRYDIKTFPQIFQQGSNPEKYILFSE